jgi:hypothetical protein
MGRATSGVADLLLAGLSRPGYKAGFDGRVSGETAGRRKILSADGMGSLQEAPRRLPGFGRPSREIMAISRC